MNSSLPTINIFFTIKWQLSYFVLYKLSYIFPVGFIPYIFFIAIFPSKQLGGFFYINVEGLELCNNLSNEKGNNLKL